MPEPTPFEKMTFEELDEARSEAERQAAFWHERLIMCDFHILCRDHIRRQEKRNRINELQAEIDALNSELECSNE